MGLWLDGGMLEFKGVASRFDGGTLGSTSWLDRGLKVCIHLWTVLYL